MLSLSLALPISPSLARRPFFSLALTSPLPRPLASLQDPVFRQQDYHSLKEYRDLTVQRLIALLRARHFSVTDYKDDPLRFLAGMEQAGVVDYSLSIKSGVHYTLCGGTIATLGNERQRAEYLPKLDSLELPGCFAMTELGHGSNVVSIRTTATYDPARGAFVVRTPDDDASKFWIGGSAMSAKVSVVFANLIVKGENHGVHVLVVRLRDDAGNVVPNVRIKDNGPKMGLNGVDNGQIWFDDLVVPRENLLDRFGSVSADGTYSSPLPTPAARFGATVGGLTTGRVLLAQGAVDAAKLGILIAVRYSASRTQFGNVPILDYATQRRRLLIPLAETYALNFAVLKLKAIFPQRFDSKKAAKEVHLLSSGLKAAATWARVRTLQECRESCGGMGVLSANRIGPLIADMNVDVTFEGDNTVLMQQVAKELAKAGAAGAGEPPAAPGGVELSGSGGSSLRLSPAQIGSLLAWRVDYVTAKQVAALGAAVAAGTKPLVAWNDATDVAVKLGWAWSEKVAFDALLEAAERAPEQGIRDALLVLVELYGLSRIENAALDYAVAGVLKAGGEDALRARVAELLEALAGNRAKLALELIDGFGLDDDLVRAPIARDWKTAFSYDRVLY